MLARGTFGLVLLLLGACSRSEGVAPTVEVRQSPAPAPGVASASRKAFGAPIGGGAPVKLAALLRAPETFVDHSVVVEGEVRRACTRKGCWMELSEGQDPALPGCRVTFRDYGFFVPTDSAGSKARVEAKVETKSIKPSMVTHLEDEGAKFSEKSADGSAREVRLVASGVELWR